MLDYCIRLIYKGTSSYDLLYRASMVFKAICLAVLLTIGAAVGFSSEKFVSFHTSKYQNQGLGIYDGSKTTIQKHPYEVSLLYSGQLLCAGAIVSSSWIITLGDCAAAMDSSSTVVAGSSDGLKGKSYSIKNIVLHPSYGQIILDYDYGCIQIKGKFKWSSKTKPIKLPKKDPKANSAVIVSGWGNTQNSEASNGKMLQGTMKWLAEKKCSSFYSPYGLTWTSRMACTYNKGKTTLCDGDFGDPFVQNGVVVGVFATTLSDGFCTNQAAPLILADIYNVTSWIKTTTGAKYEDEI